MSEVVVERPHEGVAVIRVQRPEARNALNMKVREALSQAFAALGADDGVRCIVLTGTDKFFVAGADLREMAELTGGDHLRRRTEALWRPIAQCPKPMIAAVNGYALGGGCELAMHCDIIVAGESAQFGQPEVRVGIMPGAGGTQRLPRAVGKFKAMRMLLTGRPVSAREADAMGLVSEVVADDKVLEHALALAQEIAALPALAVRQIKEAVLAGQDMALDAAVALERKAFQLLFDTEDQKEGMRAFLEKRKPAFKGR
jgi:enoyl-CoA hydratase